jgi:phosphate transport system substrate-binding protein
MVLAHFLEHLRGALDSLSRSKWTSCFPTIMRVRILHVGVLALIILASCRPSPDHLLLAAKQGKVEEIQQLLDRGVPITVADHAGETSLHLAAQWGREDVAAVLLDRGAPLEAANIEGRTPLHIAAKENQESLIKLFLDRGAALEATDRFGSTPLHLAVEWNAGDAVRTLIARKAALQAHNKNGHTPLHTAAVWGAEEAAQLLLDAGAAVTAAGNQGQTPLHLTAKGTRRLFETTKGQHAIARLLLDRGAHTEAAMQDGMTALHTAAREGDAELVRLLIERRAIVDTKTREGLTPLHKAIMYNQTPVVLLLLDKGANIETRENHGKSSLHLAAELGQGNMVRLLLDKAASVRATDSEGRTPLHEPAGRGHETVVRLLLERGATIEALDRYGWSPLHLAAFHGREQIVRFLLDRGAQVNRGDAQGVTPLHGAAYFGYEGIQQLLIQRGATADLVDDRGYTAAQYAKPQGKISTDDVIPAETVQPISAAQSGVARLHLPLIKIDGSSTVYPLSALVAERYAEAGSGSVRVTVGISGTGGGFQKFCRGETDLQDASRPISAVELESCQRNGIQFFELPIGYDALSVVVSVNNTWVESLTLKELKAMWEPEAHMKTMSWNQIRSDWPAVPLKLFGAGPDSGTFDYFTEAVVGKVKASRVDYTGSEDDNVLVDGIAASRLALGYVPFGYLEPNRQRLKAVAIDAGNGPILPTKETVVSGQYHPLSRPIFLYVNQRSAIDSAVRQFVEYYLSQAPQFVDQIGCIPFPTNAYTSILSQFRKGKLGTLFAGKSPIGMTIEQFLSFQGIPESIHGNDS